MKDYYRVLDLPADASPQKIKDRYRQLVRFFHPDRFQNDDDRAYAAQRLQEINEAYTVLINRTHHGGSDLRLPDPIVWPQQLDFGSLLQGERGQKSVQIGNSGGDAESLQFHFSQENNWFTITKGTRLYESKPLPMVLEIEANTANLAVNQKHDGWIQVEMDGISARIVLMVEVVDKAKQPVAWSRLALSAITIFFIAGVLFGPRLMRANRQEVPLATAERTSEQNAAALPVSWTATPAAPPESTSVVVAVTAPVSPADESNAPATLTDSDDGAVEAAPGDAAPSPSGGLVVALAAAVSTETAAPTATATPTTSVAASVTTSVTAPSAATATATATGTATATPYPTPAETAAVAAAIPTFTVAPTISPTATATAAAAATAAPSATNRPTAPATRTPTPTRTVPATPTATATLVNNASVQLTVPESYKVNARAATTVDSAILAVLDLGTTHRVVARTYDDSWLQIVLPDGQAAWVFAGSVDVTGVLGLLPVIITNAAGEAIATLDESPAPAAPEPAGTEVVGTEVVDREVVDSDAVEAAPTASLPTEPATPLPDGSRLHTVAPGEYLKQLALLYYGDELLWSLIYDANLDVIGADPNILSAGQQLVIPPAP